MNTKYAFYHWAREALADHYTTLHIDFCLFPHAEPDNKLARSGHILSEWKSRADHRLRVNKEGELVEKGKKQIT
jgi:hypothetical protein